MKMDFSRSQEKVRDLDQIKFWRLMSDCSFSSWNHTHCEGNNDPFETVINMISPLSVKEKKSIYTYT